MRSPLLTPILFVVSLGAVWKPALSQSTPNKSRDANPAREAFIAGTTAFNAGDLQAAARFFKKAVAAAPRIAAPHGALGAVLLAQGEPAQAIAELTAAYRIDPNDRATTLNLAAADSLVGNTKTASELFHLVQKSDPAAGDALGRDTAIPIAAALSQQDDLPGATSLLTRASAAAPDDELLKDALGTLQAASGNYADAELTLRSAIALNQSLAAAHFHLGALLIQTHRQEEAVAELARAHELDPSSTATVLQFSHALLETGREADAVTLLRATLNMVKSTAAQRNDLRYQLALALQTTGEVKDALPLFDESVQAFASNPEVLINAGLDHVQTGDAAGGISLYLRALKAGPPTATLYENLGVAYLQQSDLNHALEQFRAGLAAEPGRPELHYDLALALKLKDDLPAAIPEFEKAAALDPTLPDPPYTLGIIYMQQGRFAEAVTNLERAVSLRPGNGDAWATLGSVYRQAGENDKAVAALREAMRLLPEQPSPHITLAAILAAQGHLEEAKTERKIGADLTRTAFNRQKAGFGVDSGTLMLKRGQVAEALLQFQDAVSADPSSAPAHAGLALALDRSGRKAEASEERRKAATLEATKSSDTPRH